MEYTIEELLSLIERHDQHEDYYREMLVQRVKAEARREAAALIRAARTDENAWDRTCDDFREAGWDGQPDEYEQMFWQAALSYAAALVDGDRP